MARIQVQFPAGDPAALERAAEAEFRDRRQPLQQRPHLGAGVAVPRGDFQWRPGRTGPAADRARFAAAVDPPGAAVPAGVVQFVQGGRVHHAELRPAAPHQRDVDGVLGAPGQQFAGAVERVDQPVFGPVPALGPGRDAAFLRQRGQRRAERGEAGLDHPVRGEVGGGHGRAVRFLEHLVAGAVDRQDGLARGPRQTDDRRQQGGGLDRSHGAVRLAGSRTLPCRPPPRSGRGGAGRRRIGRRMRCWRATIARRGVLPPLASAIA